MAKKPAIDPKKSGQDAIFAWLPYIRQIRNDLGMTPETLSDATVLALIEIESRGDPKAHRANSQYWGLLQIGTDNGATFGLLPSTMAGMTDIDAGVTSIRHFMRYASLNKSSHEWVPEMVALMWKGGAGTVRKYKRIVASEGRNAGNAYLGTLWEGSPLTYIKRFSSYYAKWNAKAEVIPGSAITIDYSATSIPTRDYEGGFVRNVGITLPRGCMQSSDTPKIEVREKTTDTAKLKRVNTIVENVMEVVTGNLQVTGIPSGAPPDVGRQVRGMLRDSKGEYVTYLFRIPKASTKPSFNRPLVDAEIAGIPWGTIRPPIVDPQLGIDLIPPTPWAGAPRSVYAIGDGEMLPPEDIGGSRYRLTIYHGQGISSVYSNLRSVTVKGSAASRRVSAGEIIGTIGLVDGHTNFSPVTMDLTSFALHFSTRLNVGYIQSRETSQNGVGRVLGTVTSPEYNIAFDPTVILAGTDNPGVVRAYEPPGTVELREARESMQDMALQSKSRAPGIQASNAADVCSAALRGVDLSNMTRYDFYETQARNYIATTEPLVAQLDVSVSSFETT